MRVEYGKGKTKGGPGISIRLTGNDVAIAIDAYLVAHGIRVNGARTIRVNGELCGRGEIYVDPSGFVNVGGETMYGRGPDASRENEVAEIIDNLRGALATPLNVVPSKVRAVLPSVRSFAENSDEILERVEIVAGIVASTKCNHEDLESEVTHLISLLTQETGLDDWGNDLSYTRN
ncbi:hypothetical protein E0J20_09390 [Rhizobium leguminosarum bv. viciae]|nr:hypothetical protein E0J20_09390 [Rhizobium leguminosarum bv. viciae]